MNAQNLPWPIRDERSWLWNARSFSDMHDVVATLTVPDGLSQRTASVVATVRELIRFSYFHYEFSTIAVALSLTTVEVALADRYGNKKFIDLIDQAADNGLFTEKDREILHFGRRKIRNKYAHGDLTGAALTPALAVSMVETSLGALAVLTARDDHKLPAGD